MPDVVGRVQGSELEGQTKRLGRWRYWGWSRSVLSVPVRKLKIGDSLSFGSRPSHSKDLTNSNPGAVADFSGEEGRIWRFLPL